MLTAAARALSQLFDRALWGVLILSVACAVVVTGAVWLAIGTLLAHVRLFDLGWLDWIARVTIGVAGIFGFAALFGTLAAIIAGFFLERVARAVERRYYPGLPPCRRQRVGDQLRTGASFLLATAVLNLLALPLYLIWGANLLIFLALNGYLLGRQYFEMIALRRVDRIAMIRLRRTHSFRLMLGGGGIASLSFVPLANLLAPVLATAFMVHIFQQISEFQKGLPEGAVR